MQKPKPFRLLITGSRTWGTQGEDLRRMYRALDKIAEGVGYRFPTLVHGGAPGADNLAGFYWAHTLQLPVEVHSADWSRGRNAGYARNAVMVNLGANLCLAFIRDGSRGASHCAELAEAKGIKTIKYLSGLGTIHH